MPFIDQIQFFFPRKTRDFKAFTVPDDSNGSEDVKGFEGFNGMRNARISRGF